MEAEKNISGISENLSDSIADQKVAEKAEVNKGSLYKRRIAISVSECEELEQLGLSEQHIKDISIEIARYLIVNGATMLYGGDLRIGGFTELFAELSYQYKYLSDKEYRFINYFPFPNSKFISDEVKANLLKQQVEAKIIEAPKHLGKIDFDKKYLPFESVEDRFIYSECFADMRIKMANDCNARIVLGGRQKGFLGYFPGIVEETFHSLNAGRPIYLLGGFGGATKSIIEIISGRKAEQLTNEFQFETDFLQAFKKYVADKSIVKIDYDFIMESFRGHSIESISKQNGLSVEENQILFESNNIHELVFLIIKGLQNISK